MRNVNSCSFFAGQLETVCGAGEVAPCGPAPGNGWKNTTRSNVGALGPQPVPPADPPADAPAPADLPELGGSVALEHVDFRYEPSKPLIADFNLEVRPGQTIAIVGPTGAGKTTVVNLLMRFYEIDSGVIRLDGLDARALLSSDLAWSGRILSLTTIATPHLGSSLADFAKLRVGRIYRLLEALGIDHQGFLDVTCKAARLFNEATPAPEEIPCFSVAGNPSASTTGKVCGGSSLRRESPG